MIRFYLKFEDIEKEKYLECSSLESVEVDLLNHGRLSESRYSSMYLGEAKPELQNLYILVESIDYKETTRRRGYLEVSDDVVEKLLFHFPVFVPSPRHVARRIGREARDGLLLEEAVRRLSKRAALADFPEITDLLEELETMLPPMREILLKLIRWSDSIQFPEAPYEASQKSPNAFYSRFKEKVLDQ